MDSEEHQNTPPEGTDQTAADTTPSEEGVVSAPAETVPAAPAGSEEQPVTADSTDSGDTEGGAQTMPLLWAAGVALLVIAAVIIGAVAITKSHNAASATPTPIVPALSTPAPQATPVVTGGSVAAIVNGVSIPMSTFRTFLGLNEKQAAAQSPTGAPPMSLIVQQTYNEVITQSLVEQYARTHHITVSPAEVNAQLNVEYQRNGGKAAFEQRLAQFGLTPSVYKTVLLAPSVLSHKVVDQIAPLPKKPVPGAVQPVAKVRHILISLHTQGKPARTDAQAHALAQTVLGKLQHGASFAALVKQYSDDPGSINTGGVYTVHPHEMVPQFDYASFHLALHRPTIIHTQFGYHIIEVLSRGRAPGPAQSPQQVQQAKISAWIAQQMKKAKVKRIAQVKG